MKVPTPPDPARPTDWQRLRAPAKLTTNLRITGVREDGYHLIDAEMVTLDLADELRIGPGDGLAITYEDDVGPGLGLGEPGDNLILKALELVDRRVAVELLKRIPPGAGLGGGSADAAAILRWAGMVDPTRAVELGADVAFCVVGGRARVRGIGEQITPLAFRSQTFTLLTPSFGCSTVAVYQQWDRMGGPTGEWGNDLEPAALVVEPALAVARDQLGARSGLRPRLAGSGSTWFVEGAFDGPGLVVASTIPGL